MKLKFIAIIFLSGALFVRGQGTFIWDQGFTNITDAAVALTNTPLGQGFTPTTSSMDTAAFFLSVGNLGTDGDVEIEVRNGSVTGAIIGTSNPEAVSGSGSIFYFTFSDPVTLTPGTEYYLQPVEISGNNIGAQVGIAAPGTGQAIFGGVLSKNLNFWFEEGVQVAPEPSLSALFVIGGIAFWHRRKRLVADEA